MAQAHDVLQVAAKRKRSELGDDVAGVIGEFSGDFAHQLKVMRKTQIRRYLSVVVADFKELCRQRAGDMECRATMRFPLPWEMSHFLSLPRGGRELRQWYRDVGDFMDNNPCLELCKLSGTRDGVEFCWHGIGAAQGQHAAELRQLRHASLRAYLIKEIGRFKNMCLHAAKDYCSSCEMSIKIPEVENAEEWEADASALLRTALLPGAGLPTARVGTGPGTARTPLQLQLRWETELPWAGQF
eukprot:TRINITY_DN8154_c0_g1_i2.p1 TRINITY_DN8154_c0_g1~~TRINITY_DN8154_c0_g1_i2.p1  ORF type:complete len:242 (+),score=67.86 TRINITY_DN8154_c0_g1_i2:95-820(+)